MMKFKILFFMVAVCGIAFQAEAQERKRTSPKDEVSGTVGGAKVEIVYCRPSADNRKVMGDLVPFGQVWRTGANQATTITFDKPVKIEGKDLAAGKYALFTIPGEKEWTIILNSDHGQWGAYNYDESKDALRVTVKPTKTSQFVETFTITPEKDRVSLKWESTEVAFKVKA